MVLGGLTRTAPYNNVGDTTLKTKVIDHWQFIHTCKLGLQKLCKLVLGLSGAESESCAACLRGPRCLQGL